MAFDIADALHKGFDRTTTRVAVVFMAILFVLGTLNELVGIGMARWLLDQPFARDLPFGGPVPATPAVDVAPINPAVGGALSLLFSILILVATIAAIRTFVTSETERVPREHFSRRILWAGLNYFFGAIAFVIIVGIGLILLIIPGIFLLVTLWFWTVFVAVEDENFIDALGSSWALTRGNRLYLFVLGLAVVILSAIFSTIFTLGGAIGGLVGLLLGQAAFAITTTFTLATVAQTYNILTNEARIDSGTDEPSADDVIVN